MKQDEAQAALAARLVVIEMLLLRLIEAFESGVLLERPERRRGLMQLALRGIDVALNRDWLAAQEAHKPFAAECSRQFDRLQHRLAQMRAQ